MLHRARLRSRWLPEGGSSPQLCCSGWSWVPGSMPLAGASHTATFGDHHRDPARCDGGTSSLMISGWASRAARLAIHGADLDSRRRAAPSPARGQPSRPAGDEPLSSPGSRGLGFISPPMAGSAGWRSRGLGSPYRPPRQQLLIDWRRRYRGDQHERVSTGEVDRRVAGQGGLREPVLVLRDLV